VGSSTSSSGLRFGRRAGITAAVAALTLKAATADPATAVAVPDKGDPTANDTIVVRWNAMGLAAVKQSTMGPPMIARAMAVLHTAIYDAWAAHTQRSLATRSGNELRQPTSEQTARNKNAALSYAAYTAALDLWPESKAMFDEFMNGMGYPPERSTTTACSVGKASCHAVLEYRHDDGSNQLGDLHPGPYSDYTGYKPANAPMVVAKALDPATVKDPNRWQPLTYTARSKKVVTPSFLTPHWGRVLPFGMSNWEEVKPSTRPARYGTDAYVEQAQAIVDLTAGLDDRRKAIAEYWADGPGTVQPPGHWSQIGQYVSRRDGNTVDQDVTLFFILTNALFDAAIAAWGAKRLVDSVRPITAVRFLNRGRRIPSWPRAGSGPDLIDGALWTPYQPTWFPTPPFGEWVSGHSTFSAAAAEVLKRFTGSDTFGARVVVPAGSSNVEPGKSPRSDVTLSWPTFSAAADEAGISRRYGGIHFEDGDLAGRAMGRLIGAKAFERATKYISGNATP
jgi:hypothetical protein